MINVNQLTKKFRVGLDEVVAVDKLSFRVRAGEVFGLLGPNGAGKTTTLRMIMGLLAPDSGIVEVDGVHSGPDMSATRRKIGLVSANDGVYPWLTAEEMLLYFADLYEVPPARARERLAFLKDLLDLGRFIKQRCTTLSTGQKQRIILARGLMHDPPVMLLDEPTRGLDVIGSKVIFDFIKHLKQQGKAVLLSTHRLDEAERICDRFGLLYRGKLQHQGTMSELHEATGDSHLVDMFLHFMGQTSSLETIPCPD